MDRTSPSQKPSYAQPREPALTSRDEPSVDDRPGNAPTAERTAPTVAGADHTSGAGSSSGLEIRLSWSVAVADAATADRLEAAQAQAIKEALVWLSQHVHQSRSTF